MKGILINDSNEIVISPVRDSEGLITSGIVVEDSVYQQIRLIIELQKGEIKQYPTLGFGLQNYLKAPNGDNQKFIAELTKQLKSDGIDARITIENGKFEVEVL